MPGQVRARLVGDEYQHRFFWIEACRLFAPQRDVVGVSLEAGGLRAFDDVVTRYDRPRWDAHGRSYQADHYQLKYKLRRARRFTAYDLIDPDFINATSVSLLERAAAAVRGNGEGRLHLVTPLDYDQDDVLASLVENDGAMRVDDLFAGGARSKVGRVREAWRVKLGGVEDDVLRAVASRLAFWPNKQQADFDRELDRSLQTAGLVAVDYSSRVHPYLALSTRFVRDRTLEHDWDGLKSILANERLTRDDSSSASTPQPERLGVKSFERFAFALEDEGDVINLVPVFHGRHLDERLEWNRDVYRPLRRFLSDRIRSGQSHDVFLDCHLSIAYAGGLTAGKADADIAPVDRRTRTTWRPRDGQRTEEVWDWREATIGEGDELGVAIEVTRAVADDVAAYVSSNGVGIGRLLVLTVKNGVGPSAVRDADHAAALARDAVSIVTRERRARERGRPLHVFQAVPVPLAWMLGVEGRALGPTVLYEYDFDSQALGAYARAIELPDQEE